MSRIKEPSTTPSTTTGSAPPTKNIRWFFIRFADADDPEVDETLLCIVNPDNSLEKDADEIRTCLRAAFNKNSNNAGIQCVSVEIPEKGFRGMLTVKASLKQLVMHLRQVPEWENAPSTDPTEPDLWGSDDNKLVVHFLDKSEAEDVTMDQ